jgi:hypothetical protein
VVAMAKPVTGRRSIFEALATLCNLVLFYSELIIGGIDDQSEFEAYRAAS